MNVASRGRGGRGRGGSSRGRGVIAILLYIFVPTCIKMVNSFARSVLRVIPLQYSLCDCCCFAYCTSSKNENVYFTSVECVRCNYCTRHSFVHI